MKKLNILDIFFIFVIVFVIAFAVFRIFFFGGNSGEAKSTNASQIISDNAVATTTFRVKKLRSIAADAITLDGECYDDKGNFLGKIKNVSKELYYEYNANENNEFVKSVFDNRYTVTFTVDVPGRETVSGFMCENLTNLGIGGIKYVVCNGVKLETFVTDIDVNY